MTITAAVTIVNQVFAGSYNTPSPNTIANSFVDINPLLSLLKGLTTYEDSYYLGQTLGDLINLGISVGMVAAAIDIILGGAGLTGAGIASSETGVGVLVAVAGV